MSAKSEKEQAADDILAWLGCQLANTTSPDGAAELHKAIAEVAKMRDAYAREAAFFAAQTRCAQNTPPKE